MFFFRITGVGSNEKSEFISEYSLSTPAFVNPQKGNVTYKLRGDK